MSEATLGIADVERETGLGKDTLRVWERRYGFPTPERDAQGDRRYDPAQVRRLHLLRRLLSAGHRPGQVVSLPEAELQVLVGRIASAPTASAPTVRRRGRPPRFARGPEPEAAPAAAPGLAHVRPWLDAVRRGDLAELGASLRAQVQRAGLVLTLDAWVGPFLHEVGAAWARGDLSVYQEHACSALVEGVLREWTAQHARQVGPRVLLATPAGELHTLGLSMAEAVICESGCVGIRLGADTPVNDIAAASRDFGVDALALGGSSHARPRLFTDQVLRLRALLPPGCALWVGGARLLGPRTADVDVLDSMASLAVRARALAAN